MKHHFIGTIWNINTLMNDFGPWTDAPLEPAAPRSRSVQKLVPTRRSEKVLELVKKQAQSARLSSHRQGLSCRQVTVREVLGKTEFTPLPIFDRSSKLNIRQPPPFSRSQLPQVSRSTSKNSGPKTCSEAICAMFGHAACFRKQLRKQFRRKFNKALKVR